jgi:hypothetical protein
MAGLGVAALAAAQVLSGPTVEVAANPAVSVRDLTLAETDKGWRISAFVCRPLGAVGAWPDRAVVELLDSQGQVAETRWVPTPRLAAGRARPGCRPLTLRFKTPPHPQGRVVVRFD